MQTVKGYLLQHRAVALVFRPRLLGVAACLLALLSAGLMADHDLAALGVDDPIQTFAADAPLPVPVSPAQGLGADCAVQAYCSGFLPALVVQHVALDSKFVRVLEALDIPYGRTTAPASPPPKHILAA